LSYDILKKKKNNKTLIQNRFFSPGGVCLLVYSKITILPGSHAKNIFKKHVGRHLLGYMIIIGDQLPFRSFVET
jgi:hypothetical protein